MRHITTKSSLQRSALIKLFDSTRGSDWRDNSNWLTETSECSWHGVKCNKNAEVIGLNLCKVSFIFLLFHLTIFTMGI